MSQVSIGIAQFEGAGYRYCKSLVTETDLVPKNVCPDDLSISAMESLFHLESEDRMRSIMKIAIVPLEIAISKERSERKEQLDEISKYIEKMEGRGIQWNLQSLRPRHRLNKVDKMKL